jgi:hypothetical protein
MTREGLPFIDEQRIASALPKAEVSLFALSELMDEARWPPGLRSAWPTSMPLQ